MMPIAMSVGAVFYSSLYRLSNIIPLLIFIMLLLTYLKMDFKKIALKKQYFILIAYQLLAGVGLYFLVSQFNNTLAQGIMICILAPTATSAPVIVGMLKGNVETVLSYSLLSNLTIVFLSPIIFSFTGEIKDIIFLQSAWSIAKHIVPLLFAPFLFAFLVSPFLKTKWKKSPRLNDFSFLLWAVSLALVTAKIIYFISTQQTNALQTLILLAVASCIIAVFQFWFGRKFGSRYNRTIAFGQGLGQKNTVLAIWLAQMYLNPISSVAPGSYVIWQNIINSYQVWKKRKMLG